MPGIGHQLVEPGTLHLGAADLVRVLLNDLVAALLGLQTRRLAYREIAHIAIHVCEHVLPARYTMITRLQRLGGLVSDLGHESKDKIKDVLSSILGSAVGFGLLVNNPVEAIRLPAQKSGRKRIKPHVTPEQFDKLLTQIQEPYASMIYVAVYTGLRVSELIGLRWNDVLMTEQLKDNGEKEIRYAISIDERYCRGDWGAPKSDASNATIGINECVYRRIQQLKLLTVEVRAGRATRRYKVVKSDGPEDLVFQSVKTERQCGTTTS